MEDRVGDFSWARCKLAGFSAVIRHSIAWPEIWISSWLTDSSCQQPNFNLLFLIIPVTNSVTGCSTWTRGIHLHEVKFAFTFIVKLDCPSIFTSQQILPHGQLQIRFGLRLSYRYRMEILQDFWLFLWRTIRSPKWTTCPRWSAKFEPQPYWLGRWRVQALTPNCQGAQKLIKAVNWNWVLCPFYFTDTFTATSADALGL